MARALNGENNEKARPENVLLIILTDYNMAVPVILSLYYSI